MINLKIDIDSNHLGRRTLTFGSREDLVKEELSLDDPDITLDGGHLPYDYILKMSHDYFNDLPEAP